jgi:hypothetical protein
MPHSYSSGHFAAVAFFALVAYIAYSVGSTSTLESIERREADRAARQHSVYADQNISSACGDLTGAELVVCAQEQIERSAEYQNAEYDLSAQEQMASFAKKSLWVSIASIGITGLGIYLVWGTLAEARKATVAAQDAVQVTREIGEAQVSAYLSLESGDATLLTTNVSTCWSKSKTLARPLQLMCAGGLECLFGTKEVSFSPLFNRSPLETCQAAQSRVWAASFSTALKPILWL